MPGNVKTLQLSVVLNDPGRPDYPVVTILVDGEDVLAPLNGGFMGFDPAEILESGALLPTDPPRRVAVYRCDCGEAGCGCVAPVIELIGERVRWRDFRDFTGVYNRPLDDPAPTGGSPLGLMDIDFDADQYRQEVERAAADRGWETADRQTARLVLEILRRSDDHFTKQGYWRGWVAPRWNQPGTFVIEFIGPLGQVLVVLSPTADSPEARAAEMAHELFTTEPEDWAIDIRHIWPPEQVTGAIAARQAARDRTT